MRRSLLVSILALVSAAVVAPADGASIGDALTSTQKRSLQREALVVIEFLQGFHYSDRPFHELNAGDVLDDFVGRLDPSRMIFTQSDVAFVRRRFERNLKSVYLFKGDLHPAFEIWDLYAAKATARYEWLERRLSRPFDLEAGGTFALDRKKAGWPKDAAAADALWEASLAASLVEKMLRGLSQADALEALKRDHVERRKRMQRADPLLVREQFLTAVLEHFDPHSGYMSRENADDLEKRLTASAVGVGLELEVHGDDVRLAGIEPGGPADLQGGVYRGDVVTAISSGGKRTELRGRNRREASMLLLGDAGTELTLEVRTDGAPPREVKLSRAKVVLAANRARGFIVTVPRGEATETIGHIALPAFYGMAGAQGGPSVTQDVRELLAMFVREGVSGVVLDLRGNGGGLLGEAVKLAGLFIGSRPVAYVRGLDQKIIPFASTEPAAAYAGPLVLLISSSSASASEVLAGTLRHYRRAVVVGDGTTFGKGSAQDAVDLRQYRTAGFSTGDWGTMRVTRQYFYTADGRSPQRVGVAADIRLALFEIDEAAPEAKLPHALPQHAIKPPEPASPPMAVRTFDDALLTALRRAATDRLQSLPEFRIEDRLWSMWRDEVKRTELDLGLARRIEAHERQQAEAASLRKQRQALQESMGYPHRRVDLAAVQELIEKRRAAYRQRLGGDGRPVLNRFDHDTYYHELEPAGPIRAVHVDMFDYVAATADAEALRNAWAEATGESLSVEHTRTILRSLDNRQTDAEGGVESVATVFRRHVGSGLDAGKFAAGLDAFFRRMVALEPDLRSDTMRYDVAAREALRVAADWAGTVSESNPPRPGPDIGENAGVGR